MRCNLFYAPPGTAAVSHAIQHLQQAGCTFTDAPGETVTHLLLPVPSFLSKAGGDLEKILGHLPENVCIFGGNLPKLPGYRVYDLLQDPFYLAENAYITAHCALRLLMKHLPIPLRGCKILVVGWGRIGKCLAALLKALEADVTVAARKETDRGILSALGYRTLDTENVPCDNFRVVFNTAPAAITLKNSDTCLKIDLASLPGITGEDVIWARGLPGKDAPEASGALIARTVLRLLHREDSV